MRRTLEPLLAGLLVLTAVGCGQKKEAAKPVEAPKATLTLEVACWDDYITPEVAADYEKETGVKLAIEFVNSNELMMERMQKGQVWDLITPSDYAVQLMQEAGLLVRLRHENIPNLGNVARRFQNAVYDQELAYAVPMFWGTTGWGYDTTVYPEAPDSWSWVFDPEKRARAAGKVTLLDDMRETLGIALMYQGFSPNSKDPAELAKARDLLRSVKADTAGFAGFDTEHFEDNLQDGSHVLVQGWSGDLAQVLAGNQRLAYALPKEGFLLFVDNMAIPAASQHRDEAEKLIDYLLRPEVAAKLTNQNRNPSCNGPARAQVDRDVLAGPSFLLPDDAAFHVLRHLGADTALYEKTWAEVQAP
jgi:spermidine/putrescine transport system substrate-binding protein